MRNFQPCVLISAGCVGIYLHILHSIKCQRRTQMAEEGWDMSEAWHGTTNTMHEYVHLNR